MQIRRDQMSDLQQDARRRFVEWCVNHMRQHWPDEAGTYGDAELRAFVEVAIANGKKYGFTTQKQLAAFADASLLLGHGFENDPRFPEFRDILASPKIEPTEKAGQVFGMAVGLHAVRRAVDLAGEQP